MTTNDHSAEAFANHIVDLYRTPEYVGVDINQALADNVFAATMRFDGSPLIKTKSDPSFYLDSYAIWFKVLMKMTFGNNLHRKKHLQPFCLAFVDLPGSRGYRSSLLSRSDLLKCGYLHIHAVIALRPGRGQEVRSALAWANSRRERYGSTFIERFDPNLGSLENMIEYFKKGAEQIGQFTKHDCWDVFPR